MNCYTYLQNFNDSNESILFLVVKACAPSITEIKGPHLCQSKQDPQYTNTPMASMPMYKYTCNDDLCNVERNICEDCQLTEDRDVCCRYSKPDNKGFESNENDTENVTRIDTNQAFTITLNTFYIVFFVQKFDACF